jgi:hypothetical protein
MGTGRRDFINLGIGAAALGGVAVSRKPAQADDDAVAFELHVWVRGRIDDSGGYSPDIWRINEEIVSADAIGARLRDLEHGYSIGSDYFPPHQVLRGRAVRYVGHGR